MSLLPIKVAILGNSNLSLMKEYLYDSLSTLIRDIKFEVYCCSYGQLNQELINPSSSFYEFNPDFCWICDSLEDFYDPYFHDHYDQEKTINLYKNHLLLIKNFYINFNKPIYINTPVSLSDLRITENNSDLIKKINIIFYDTFQNCSDLKFLDITNLLINCTKSIDCRLKFIGRINYSAELHQEMCNLLTANIATMLGKNIRLIILDLDNTLWGGTIGEDGSEQIHIAGDYPGNCYKAFQNILINLKSRGILLALASKNDIDIVKEAFSTLNMPLKLNDFICIYANWNDKYKNIIEIHKETGIDFCNILFIDDSKVERSQIATKLNKIHILDLPEDPSDYIATLNKFSLLYNTSATSEDITRSQSYEDRKKWLHEKAISNNLEEFYKSLNLKIHLDDINSKTISRVEQLFSKTTQFNLTGMRYSRKELLNLISQGNAVITIAIEDYYSAYEIMGALVLLYDSSDSSYIIDNYVMSCRALGKQAEKETLKAIVLKLKENPLYGSIFTTPRNIPAQTIFSDVGFEYNTQTQRWQKPMHYSCAVSDWATIIDNCMRSNELVTDRNLDL